MCDLLRSWVAAPPENSKNNQHHTLHLIEGPLTSLEISLFLNPHTQLTPAVCPCTSFRSMLFVLEDFAHAILYPQGGGSCVFLPVFINRQT